MKLRFVLLGALITAAAFGQWEAESRVTTNVSAVDATTAGNARAVAMRGDTVHVVYHEAGSFSAIVYYRRSTDRGQTWSSAVQLSAGTSWNLAEFGCIALRGATVHTAWFDLDVMSGASRILYRRSTNSGTTWDATTTITAAGTLNEVPSLAFSGDTVHLVWDDGGSVLYYRRSTDNGASWGASPVTIATGAATGAVTAAGPIVLVSYSVGSGSAWDIYMKRSTDGGATWGNAVFIENRGTLADISSLALRGTNAWVAWYDNGSGTNDVRLRRSTDAGATWQTAADLGAGTGNQEAPCLLVTPSNILHAVYDDDSYGNYEISYRFSTDLGVTWSAATRLTNASYTSQRATLALTGADSLGVVWTDGRYSESYPDVFFRRGRTPAGGDVGCTRLLAPTGTMDSGASVTPACSVYNYGSTTETYNVRMRIGSLYNQTAQVSGHAPGAAVYVTFASWTALPRGTLAVTCSTELSGDGTPANDKQTGTVTVGVRDVGTISLLAPSGTVDSGAVVTPACSVRNWGTGAATYWVKMKIGTGYTESTQVSSHSAGTARYVTFPNWTALPRGSIAVSCSTALAADMKTANDKLTGSVLVAVRDVGTISLPAPSGTVDSGAVVTPACSTYNYGSAAATYWVKMRIGAGYSESTQVSSHAAGTARYATFPNWTALPRGSITVSCSTALAADLKVSNDKLTGSVLVGVRDVGTVSLLAPSGAVDSGAVVTPACSVYNWGTSAATYWVRMKIGSGYTESTQVSSHAAGTARYATFPGWTARPRGSVSVSCSTALAADLKTSNDRMTGTVMVNVRDVGAISLLAPSGAVDSGAVVTPACSVYNWSTGPATYWVKMKIGSGYSESTQVIGHAAGTAYYMLFPMWTALPRGSIAVSCSTALAADMKAANDKSTGSAFVGVTDLRAVAVVAPAGAIPPGSVAPQARFRNEGNRRGLTAVTFTIDASPEYRQTETLAGGLPPGLDTVVQFPDWTAVPGSFRARCSVRTAGDENPVNDTLGAAFAVGAPDVGVDMITAPVGVYDTGSTVSPGARLHNYGSAPASFRCWFVLRNPGGAEVYRQFADVAGLVPGADTALGFLGYNVGGATGDWTARCSASAAGDPQPANDFRDGGFRVAAGQHWPSGWVEVDNVPLAPSGKAVKDGGWVAADPGASRLYVAKGNKRADFYAYNPYTTAWATLAPLPPGVEQKQPYKGAAGCSDGNGHLYATKGNNTQGFWMYDAARDSWQQRAAVPLGPSNKRVKGGTDLAYAANGCVYLLKGYKNEFWKYIPAGDSWRALPDAPVGANVKWDKGSWLAFDGAHTVFAHKAKYHELHAFDTGGDTWFRTPARQGMPIPGANGRKKSKDGGSGACYGGALYALKGGNTQEFWRYRIQSDSWQQMDTMPAFGSSHRRKKVKAGGDITNFGNGAFFALKGNKTIEFWRYVLYYEATLPRSERDGVAAEPSATGDWQLAIAPNPVASGLATVSFTRALEYSGTGALRLSVFDVAGRSVLSQSLLAGRKGAVSLDLRHLSAGVYLARLSADDCTVTQKLVVQR